MGAHPRHGLVAALGMAAATVAWPAGAQSRAAVERERREFADWIRTAPLSPRRAVGVFPLGAELSLGPPAAAIPLAGVDPARLTEHEGRMALRRGNLTLPLARGRAVALGSWQLLLSGPPGRTAVTVFAAGLRAGKQPAWFGYDPGLVFSVRLSASAPGALRLLAPDGVEVEATEAGSVTFTLAGKQRTLLARRLPGASDDESELEIYFRDASNGVSSYPAGRFVSLIPGTEGRYVLDFNRARNPFCAYNTAYPCPAPWRGNSLPLPIRAGERYQGGGLSTPPVQ